MRIMFESPELGHQVSSPGGLFSGWKRNSMGEKQWLDLMMRSAMPFRAVLANR